MSDAGSDFTQLLDLAGERFGGAVLLASDEFFAPKEGLLKPGDAEWREGAYTERGKWMDGWETRRRRDDGHDWCIVRLGVPGLVRGVVVDTAFYTGNYPAACSLEACEVPGVPDAAKLAAREGVWREIVPKTPLRGNARNPIAAREVVRATHLRFRIYPDGGVARLRVHGEPVLDWPRLARRGEVDLAAAEHGGRALAWSDMHYGSAQNLLLPGRSTHMGDGWETARRRTAGHEFAIIRLGHPGVLSRVELDTDHYKGNAPGECELHGCRWTGDDIPPARTDSEPWRTLLPRTVLQPHARFVWDDVLGALGVVTHVRLRIFPEGGVARLRCFGRPALEADA